MQQSWKHTLPTIGQFIISICGFGMYALGFVIMLAVGVFYLASSGDYSQAVSFLAMAWTAATAAVLNLPSIVYAFLRLLGKPSEKSFLGDRNRLLSMMLAILPLALFAGAVLSSGDGYSLLLVSPLHLLVVIIPLWLLVDAGTRHLYMGSPQFTWGLLSVSLTVVPTLAILAEILVLGGVFAGAVSWAVYSVPNMLDLLNRFQMRLTYSNLNPETLWRIMQTYMNNPLILYLLLVVFSGFIPLIEELLKPMVLWFLAKRKMTAAEGWVAGMLAGAAFALFESMNAMTSAMNSTWVLMALGRVGAGTLHIVASGFVGWAMASAFAEGRYWQLVKAFLLAVTLHALWNALTLVMGVGKLADNSFLQSLAMVSPVGILVLFITMLLILLHNNRVLRQG